MIHAGDLLRRGDLNELERAAEWFLSLPYDVKIFVPGNHDGCFEQEEDNARALLPGVHVLIDQAVTIDGIKFWGSPWQPAYNDWAFNLERGPPLARKWNLIPDDVRVLVTHSPPSGILDDSGMPIRNGCADLLAKTKTLPTMGLHLFGHIHQSGGAVEVDGCLYSNVTTWECERDVSVFDVTYDSVAAVSISPRG